MNKYQQSLHLYNRQFKFDPTLKPKDVLIEHESLLMDNGFEKLVM